MFDLVTSAVASGARLGIGARVLATSRKPERPLELYEFEACPFCRKVRETLSALDLDAVIYPCPKRGTRYRPKVLALGGKLQFPYLIDPNQDRSLFESNQIMDYLSRTYAGLPLPEALRPGLLTLPSMTIGSILRPTRGMLARPSRLPEQPLELWGFEGSPACRPVRERLCELELPYVQHNVAPGGSAREASRAQIERGVPHLLDPNTGRELSDARAITTYLDRCYAA
jgi:glutathione S-transferase